MKEQRPDSALPEDQLTEFFRDDSFHRLLTETAREVIVVHDLQGIVRYANGTTIALTGVSDNEIVGKNVLDLLTPEERVKAAQRREKRMGFDKTVFRYETVIMTKNGALPVEVSSSLLVLNEKPAGVLLIARDISDRLKHDEEIKRLNAELEIRVRARTHELETANADLEAFASSLTHDLRAPLAAIDGMRESLELDYAEKLGAEGCEKVKSIKESTARMTALIDAMLELARTSRAKLEKQQLDLSDMARGVFLEFQAAEPKRQVTIEIEDEIVAFGDPTLLRSALRNLLGNAWKFTSHSSDAKIVFRTGCCHETPDDYACFIVEDNGIGLEENDANNLFHAFNRLPGSEEFEGFGIGLASAERVITRHEGMLGAHAKPGIGATFWFCLPKGE